jgi:signal transduction histidine kinase
MIPLISVELGLEHDIVLARQRTRLVARLLGFDYQEQTRLTTALSEIARNAFQYAGGGKVEFAVDGAPPRDLIIRVTDRGPGIANLEEILSGGYRSKTGLGLGILGARRLLDKVNIRTAPGEGVQVVMTKALPARRVGHAPLDLKIVSEELSRPAEQSPFDEMQRQNQDLILALDELRQGQEALAEVNRELEDTNRGVMALYAELDEKAQQLERANVLKTSFLSNVSHEFRTPLNSILGLSQLLLDRVDGELTSEQEKQLTYIRRSASSLSELVNDLLDTAKIESGVVEVYDQAFSITDLFSSLRGMFRPLLLSGDVTLQFDDVSGLPQMQSDEGKVAQILRNFISNALKFTERGTIRVSAMLEGDRFIVFSVADDGIGIATQDQQRIFTDFTQIDGAVQRRFKGTGLGLPLTRKLAQLLGGKVEVESVITVGSTFLATIPLRYSGPATARLENPEPAEAGSATERRAGNG